MNVISNAVQVVAAIIQLRSPHPQEADQILIVRRGPAQSGAGFWEFPGGKVEVGESFEQALRREIQEELDIDIQVGIRLGEEVHAYPNKVIHLIVYLATTDQRQLRLSEHDAFQWVRPQEIDISILSAADRPFVERLISHFKLQGSK